MNENQLIDFFKSAENSGDVEGAKAALDAILELRSSKSEEAPTEYDSFEYYSDKAKKGVAGLASMPGMLIDGINIAFEIVSPMHKLGYFPRLGEKSHEAASEALGVRDLKPRTTMEEYAGPMVEFGAGSIIPATGLAVKAKQGSIVVADVVSSIISGFSSKVGGDITEQISGDRSTGEVVGALTGGFAPSATQKMYEKSKGLVRSKDRNKTIERIKRNQALIDLDKELGLVEGGEGWENLKRAQELTAKTGVQFDIDQAMLTPGSQAIKETALRLQRGKHTEAVAWDVAQQKKAQEFLDLKYPSSDINPIDVARANHDHMVQSLQNSIKNLESKRLEFVESATDVPAAAQTGSKMRDLYNAAYNAARDTKNALYDYVYKLADQSNVKVDVSDIQSYMHKHVGKAENTFENIPAPIHQMINEWDKTVSPIVDASGKSIRTGKMVGFKEFHSLLREANRQFNIAKKANDTNKMYHIGKLKSILDDKLNAVESIPGDVGKTLQSVNTWFKNEYKPFFQEGLGGRIRSYGKFGETIEDADLVGRLVFQTGKSKGADDYLKIFGGSDESTQLLKDGAISIIARKKKDGLIAPSAIENFRAQNREALSRFPAVDEYLSDINRVNTDIVKRKIQQEKIYNELSGDVLAQRGIDTSDEVLEAAITNKKLMHSIVSKLEGDDAAINSLRASIAQKIVKTNRPYDALLKNKNILVDVFDSDHWDDIVTIAETFQRQKQSPILPPPYLRETEDLSEKLIGSRFSTVWASYTAAARGRTSIGVETAGMATRFMRHNVNKAKENIAYEVLHNPKLAHELANGIRKPNVRPDFALIDEAILTTLVRGNIASQDKPDDNDEQKVTAKNITSKNNMKPIPMPQIEQPDFGVPQVKQPAQTMLPPSMRQQGTLLNAMAEQRGYAQGGIVSLNNPISNPYNPYNPGYQEGLIGREGSSIGYKESRPIERVSDVIATLSAINNNNGIMSIDVENETYVM